MSDPQTVGGFAGDPTEVLSVAGAGGCCGNPPRTALVLPDATAGPCCGTPAEATAGSPCCGSAAKAEAVTAGQGCC
ncbi:hypothetical protein [Paractinoplanes hotanensis]|uniref:Uncharacterized protein n=1 Tax=Paractinoplanes hotanensis TaxID=2906497 RepID=A0ABT0Y4X1_9ACTN|nr:hypothetical protein [Actinoplanes hotanensis]MCM4081085.1 hypothetical protein [Actinoplanes hotanensis]